MTMMPMQEELTAFGALAIFGTAALLSAMLIVVLRPLLAHYAVARPNPRSSHKLPTPQGGGIPVLAAMIVVSSGALYFFPAEETAAFRLPILFAAILLIAGVGVLADKHPENVGSRLLLQAIAVSLVGFELPPDLRVLPILPLPAERIVLALSGLWFVNLVNFMDGLDWMTVAEIVPITATLALIGFLGMLPPPAIVVSVALCGAIVGFAYFNRPVAKLFLGDVGSLPIGLVLCWLLILLAGNGAYAAAILLPLYYLSDSTITLIRRVLNGEQVLQAHRTHFYQRATKRGFSVSEVVARVFMLNLCLCSLAIATVLLPDQRSAIVAVVVGGALIAWTLTVFARGRQQNSSSGY
jgi:UDP-N-acetylmuramyl pentapeptide phosphotransferase/UDP-N-acetylglucosamine-1-phosphate transferase